MPTYEGIAIRTDLPERLKWKVGMALPDAPDGVYWIVQDVKEEGDKVSLICKVACSHSVDGRKLR